MDEIVSIALDTDIYIHNTYAIVYVRQQFSIEFQFELAEFVRECSKLGSNDPSLILIAFESYLCLAIYLSQVPREKKQLIWIKQKPVHLRDGSNPTEKVSN